MIIRICYRFALATFLVLLSLPSRAGALDASLAFFDVEKILKADLKADGHNEIILIGRKNPDDYSPSLIVYEKDNILVETQKALLPVENIYSPASFDGFEVEVVSSVPDLARIIDVQGELREVLHTSLGGDKLVLVSIEEGNGVYNFNIHFLYDEPSQAFVVSNVFLNVNNEQCDRSLLSVFSFPNNPLSVSVLEEFDGREGFRRLQKLGLEFQVGARHATKLMTQEISLNFDQALSAFKSSDHGYLKKVMSTFLEDGGAEASCAAENYIVAKYYFPDNPRWSNDLGFLFEQSGYSREAATLLEEVVEKHPDRVVAYLNLADSYWALGNIEGAVTMYRKYIELMGERKKAGSIPERVYERIKPGKA